MKLISLAPAFGSPYRRNINVGLKVWESFLVNMSLFHADGASSTKLSFKPREQPHSYKPALQKLQLCIYLRAQRWAALRGSCRVFYDNQTAGRAFPYGGTGKTPFRATRI